MPGFLLPLAPGEKAQYYLPCLPEKPTEGPVMHFLREFFRSKPVITLALFMLGVLYLSRDPFFAEKKLFMPLQEIIKRFPDLPRMPRFPEPLPVAQGGLYLPLAAEGQRALGRFYERLAALKQTGRGQVRILHYGDSIIWADNVTVRIRENLVQLFGNGGRGLLPLALDSEDYRLLGVRQRYSGDWTIENLITMNPVTARLGITLRRYTAGSGGQAVWNFPPEELVRTVRFLTEEAGVLLALTVQEPGGRRYEFTVTNTAPTGVPVRLPAPAASVTLRVAPGTVLFGAVFEREAGVVFSPVVRKGIFAEDFCNLERPRFVAQLRALAPDLVVFQFGKNESGWNKFTAARHEKGVRFFIAMVREAAPQCDILLLGPAGRMYRDGGTMRLYSTIKVIRDVQRRLAGELGLGYYDMFTVLGGAAGMQQLVGRGLAMGDYVHLTRQGGDMFADRMTRDLLAGYEQHLQDKGGSGGGVLKYFSKPAEGQDKTEQTAAPSSINFDTVAFIIFFLIVFFAYWLLAGTGMLRLSMLLLASYYFYMSWNPVFITLIIVSTLIDFIAGKAIHAANLEGRRHKARVYLVISLVSNLGLLFFFKYFNLFADFLKQLGGPQLSFLQLILPAGISFYTFQTMSYSLDIYAGKLKPAHSFLDFALFVTFFPQLVAGPIVRACDFLPQIRKRPLFNPVLVQQGIFLILIGLFKKVVLSDQIAVNFVERVFKSPEMFSGLENLLAVYGYGLQIYCDFSGYSDIAIGSAAMLGFHLTLNFNSPYKAVSLQEFWHRWHISLSTWLRDYLYIPLGGNKKGKVRTYLNLAVTMFLGGLWHGPAYRFILWGMLHGVGLGVVRFFQRFRVKHGLTRQFFFGKALGWFVTFNFVSFCWIFFRAESMDKAGQILGRIGTGTSYLPNVGLVVAAVLAGGYLLHFLPERLFTWCKRTFVRIPAPLQALVLLLAAVLFYKTAVSGVVPFIYFQF